jgi:hypothetical protein
MNKLDPDLKRLLKWAGAASPSTPESAPFGFSGRVLASTKRTRALTLLEELQQTSWAIAGFALALILCGSLIWASQHSPPEPAGQISSVMNLLASNLTR